MEPAAYALERIWSIWEMWNTSDMINYGANMQSIGSFSTMWDFLQLWENLPHSQPGFYFSNFKEGQERRIEGLPSPIEAVGIFVQGVIPAWEDPINAKGSDFSIRRGMDEILIKKLWKKLVFSVVGETIAISEEVVGVRIVDKGRNFKCEIWVKFDANQNLELTAQMKKWMVDCLEVKQDEIMIGLHETKSKKS